MSIRKQILNEGEFRRFMKLAKLGPVGGKRLSELGFGHEDIQEEDDELDHVEDELGATEDELGAEDHIADEEGEELDVMGDMGGGEEDMVLSLLQVIQGWAEENGVDMDLEGGEEEVGVDDLEMDAEMPMDDGGEEEVAMDVMDVEEEPGMRDVYQEEEEGSKKGEYKRRDKRGKVGTRAGDVGGGKYGKGGHYKDDETDESKMVAEIAKRVFARLQGEQRKETMVDELAERIMKRLTKKQ